MVESYENAIQIAILIICTVFSLYRTAADKSKTWALLSLSYGSWLLGDIYWLLCLIFFETTPQISVISDLSWYASYIFLYMLLRQVAPPEKAFTRKILPWLGLLFTIAMAVFFIQWGEILSNLIYAALMGLLLYSAIRRLVEKSRYQNQSFLMIAILIFCMLEYALWTSSCFFKEDTLANPYYWFDFLLSISFVLFIPAVKKTVKS